MVVVGNGVKYTINLAKKNNFRLMPLGDYGLNCIVAPSNEQHWEILSLECAVCKISVESAVRVLAGKRSS